MFAREEGETTKMVTKRRREEEGYQNLEQYRIDSPAGGFEFTAVQNNVFDTPVGDGNGVSDSFWILLEHLNPGKHTISFSGAINLDNIPPLMGLYEAGATYNLDVIPKYY